jgi:formate dehydrogenase (coenzyme F420) alpha subunit
MMAVEYQPPAEPTDNEYPFILTTGRAVMHHNSGSMTRRSLLSRKLERAVELFVEISPSDAERLQIKEGEKVVVSTRRGEVTAKAAVRKKILSGVVFVPVHFPGVNALTIDALDSKAKTPEFKVAACKIRKMNQ